MTDRDALLAAIRANPDEDAPRLMYADWLDENLPDKTPSPAAGPSARAEYIRVQCRLAGLPFDEPDYPELLERQDDLADWLGSHVPDKEKEPDLPKWFDWYGDFDGGESRTYDRGFPWEIEYQDYDDKPSVNIDRITANLPKVFAKSTVRALSMEEAYGSEIVGILADPSAAGLRGFSLASMSDNDESDDDDDRLAVRAIATSPHLANLRHLSLDIETDADGLKLLAKANFAALESFVLDSAGSTELKAIGGAKWFRNLRSLRLWLDEGSAFAAVADLPPMPNLVALTLRGSFFPTAAAVRRFAASSSFPRLGRLEFENVNLEPAHFKLLAGGEWPLRHLQFHEVRVQKGGAEAIAGAAFAETLRVLELPDGGITAGGVQALAASEKLAGLKHLNLADNPVGVGGLAALAKSKHLRGLRNLSLLRCNKDKAPLNAAALLDFLSALETPELRHLTLDTLPVGVRGARVIATRETFANLTRLSLDECGLHEAGARALVESPTLGNLAVFDARDNAAGAGLSKLGDPKVFPRLGRAWLTKNRIPKGVLGRLRKRPGVQV